MFTIKFYSGDGCRQIIREAESFTILRSYADDKSEPFVAAEITLHQKVGFESCRIDIGDERAPRPDGWPPIFAKAIIENSTGRTTEIIGQNGPSVAPRSNSKPTKSNAGDWMGV
jgi:hypothetical protein